MKSPIPITYMPSTVQKFHMCAFWLPVHCLYTACIPALGATASISGGLCRIGAYYFVDESNRYFKFT